MKRALVLGLVPVVALSACMRRTAPRAASANGDTAVAAAPAPRLAPPTVSVPVPAAGLASGPADDAAPPPPPAPAPAPDLMEEGRRAVAIDAEQRKVMLEQNLAAAREALKNADIASARTFFGKALELDPQNTEAREGWRNLNDDRPSTVGDYFDRTRREEAVRRDEAVTQVSGHMKRGHTMEAAQDYDGAIREYQSALAIVSWYADTTGFGVTADSLKDVIDRARAAAAKKSRDDRATATRRAMAERERDLAREREERLGRIRAFFREADLAFRRNEFSAAREYARLVLLEDPENKAATELIECTYDAEHAARMQYNTETFAEEWKRTFAELERAVIPQVKTVEFPDNWLSDVASRKARIVGDAPDTSDNESKQAILTALDAKRVKGLQFTDQNLDQVVTYLRTVTGLNFHITPKVRSTKFDEVKVNISNLDDVSVAQVLNLVTEPYELRWEPRNGVVTIAMKDEVAGTLRLRYFDVRDLAVKIQNFRGTDIFLAPSNYTPPEPPELPEAAPIFPTDTLVDTIKQVVETKSWETEGATLELKPPGTLIARNTQEVIDAVAQLLEELRRNSGPLVSMEVRFIQMEDNFLRDVGVDLRGLGDNDPTSLGTNAPNDDVFFGNTAAPAGVGTGSDSGVFFNDGGDGSYRGRIENLFDLVSGLGNPNVMSATGGLSLQHTFLDDTQVEVILRAVQKSERVQQITASKLTVYNTQRATVEVLNKVAYVADYDVEIAQASNIANPIIKNAIEGVVLDVKPVVSADRRFITLELRPTVATLVRPIPTIVTNLASGPVGTNSAVTIQVPRLTKSSVRTTVTMPDGGTLLLGGLKFYDQTDATSEVPVLGKIPVIGFMFSRKGSYVNRRNLSVLVSASIEALEEQEPTGEYRPPVRAEPYVMEEEQEDVIAPACAAPPPPCDPCGRR